MSDVNKKVQSVIKEFESDYFKLEQSLKKQNQNEVQKIITKLNKRMDELDNILENLLRKKEKLKKDLNSIKEKSQDKKNELNKREKCKKCKKETTIMNLYECIICYEKKCDKCTIIKNHHSNLCSNRECILINNRRNNYQGPQSSYSGL